MTAKVEPTPSLYQRLVAANLEMDSRYSDVYVRHTPEAVAIIAQYEREGGLSNKSTFTSEVDGKLWIELPFHHDPYWEKRGIKT